LERRTNPGRKAKKKKEEPPFPLESHAKISMTPRNKKTRQRKLQQEFSLGKEKNIRAVRPAAQVEAFEKPYLQHTNILKNEPTH